VSSSRRQSRPGSPHLDRRGSRKGRRRSGPRWRETILPSTKPQKPKPPKRLRQHPDAHAQHAHSSSPSPTSCSHPYEDRNCARRTLHPLIPTAPSKRDNHRRHPAQIHPKTPHFARNLCPLEPLERSRVTRPPAGWGRPYEPRLLRPGRHGSIIHASNPLGTAHTASPTSRMSRVATIPRWSSRRAPRR